MASENGEIRNYSVPTDVINEIYNIEDGKFRQGEQSGWRKFYSQCGVKVVTRSNRVNKGSININGKHNRVGGKKWCPTNYNFTTKLPIDRTKPEVDFQLTIKSTGKNKCDCDCGMFFCLLLYASYFLHATYRDKRR